MKHERPCLITFLNTENGVVNTTRSEVFLKKLEVFGNVEKHCLVFDISSHSKQKLREKRRNKIAVKIYAKRVYS